MIGRISVVGLSLCCALLFCAFVAQSASATQGTTAFTCASEAGFDDFSDAHCDTEVGASEGKFGHAQIEVGEKAEVEISNAKTKSETKETTPAVLKGTVAEVSVEISCTTVSGSATLTNKEISSVMQNEGTGVGIKYSSCTVSKPTKGCKVKEPFELTGSSITVENLGGGKNEMGLEYKPKEKSFGEITFEGSECSLKEKKAALEGTLVATGSRGSTEATSSSGGTLSFTNTMSKETLKLAGSSAEFSSTVTVSTKGEAGKPITLTTTASGEATKDDMFKSESETGSTFITGEQVGDQIFNIGIDNLVVTCEKATAKGTASGKEFTSFKVHPVYYNEETKCKWKGGTGSGSTAIVKTPTCDYLFTNQTDANERAVMHLECESNNTIIVEVGFCKVKLESQSLLGVRYENENPGKPEERAIKAKIHTTETEGFFSEGNGCISYGLPDKGKLKNSKWTYKGEFTFKGYADKDKVEEGQVGIWVE